MVTKASHPPLDLPLRRGGAIVKVELEVRGELVESGLSLLTSNAVFVEQVMPLLQKSCRFPSLTSALNLAPPLHCVVLQ